MTRPGAASISAIRSVVAFPSEFVITKVQFGLIARATAVKSGTEYRLPSSSSPLPASASLTKSPGLFPSIATFNPQYDTPKIWGRPTFSHLPLAVK
jgi:hypothetical protein